MPSTFQANGFPTRSSIPPFGFNTTQGVALSIANANTPGGANGNTTTPAIGDTRTNTFWAASGTYAFTLWYAKGSNGGIFDLYVDDVLVLSAIDTYNAASIGNATATATVYLGYAGSHTLELVVTGKNGASTNYIVSIGLILVKQAADAAIASGTVVTLSETSLPRRTMLTHDEATITAGNALAFTADTSQFLGGYWFQSASANGDTFTQSVWLRAGSYILEAIGAADVSCAKIDWTLDGVSIISGQDWYAAALTRNTRKVSTTPLILSASGYHVLTGTVNGRNASNVVAYDMKLVSYALRQAGD